MKSYYAKGDMTLVLTDVSQEASDLIRLKISSIIPTTSDVALFQGKRKANYPIVPCHMATAIVSEDREEFGLKRGSKVILNPYISNPDVSKELKSYYGTKRYGADADGFLTDFISLPMDNIILFPDDVKEDEAVFVEIVAVALATINSFKLQKGEYIAIIGASTLNIIIAQLAIYFQAIPIIIDSSFHNLELAEECGIYYSINESCEDTIQRVLDITGGKLADHSIIHAKSGLSPHFLFSLTARCGDCTVTSLNDYITKMDADISVIAKKQLEVRGVSSGEEEINSAINIIAQKILKLTILIDHQVSFDQVPILFEEMSQNTLRYNCPIIRV